MTYQVRDNGEKEGGDRGVASKLSQSGRDDAQSEDFGRVWHAGDK